jgi:hypothetical protein
MRISDLHRRILAQSQPLLLDLYPNAGAAYSLRKLRTAYTGNCIEVRRSSDNATQNIGFVNNVLDTASLLSFVGAGSGFVRTWYDQSGNARNATQSTAGNQPQIVSSGSLLTDNSKTCVQFNGSSTSLDANALASVFSGTGVFISAATVYKTFQTSPASVLAAWGFGSSSSQNPLRWLGQQVSSTSARFDERDNATATIALNTAGGTITTQALGWVNSNTTTQVLRINGAQVGTTTGSGANGVMTLNQFSIGCLPRANKGNFWGGNIQEIVIYQTDQSSNRTPIETNINSFYNIY